MMKKITGLLLILFFADTLWGSAVARVTALSGQATLSRGPNNMAVALGAALEEKDTITTAANTKAQLTFSDNTIITVGKQSKFSVEEYLDDNTPNSTAKFNMISGTIRAMSGKIGKIAPEKFAVKTKTATIGIRGTDFIIRVLPTGEFIALCMQGAITINPNDKVNIIIIPSGSFITISTDNAVSDVKEFTPSELNKVLNDGLGLPPPAETITTTTTIESEVIDTTASPEMLAVLNTLPPTADTSEIAENTASVLINTLSPSAAIDALRNVQNSAGDSQIDFSGSLTGNVTEAGVTSSITGGTLSLAVNLVSTTNTFTSNASFTAGNNSYTLNGNGDITNGNLLGTVSNINQVTTPVTGLSSQIAGVFIGPTATTIGGSISASGTIYSNPISLTGSFQTQMTGTSTP
jgi:hypothetical protein